MLKKFLFYFAICLTFPLFSEVSESVLPSMDQLVLHEFSEKISVQQQKELMHAACQRENAMRIMTFNMLCNLSWAESDLDQENWWENRGPRVVEYLERARADIVGTQELQKKQLDFLMHHLETGYAYYGVKTCLEKDKGEIPAIFYRPSRVQLLEGKTFYYSETPYQVSASADRSFNTFTVCIFRDLRTQVVFQVINTHLTFSKPESRLYEAKILYNYIASEKEKMPIVLLGDFNTFPFRQELSVPFFDGDYLISLLESSGVQDCRERAVYGHFGPLASTNYDEAKKIAFASTGTPGVILDHIFVTPGISVLSHGIDPAKIDGCWPSDHFPVLADIILPQVTENDFKF
jgi:endonuclease/exonuclease/phosphatase family metal-dependent hydrolase